MQEKKTDRQDPEPVRKEKEAHAEDLASKFAIQFFGKELLEYLGIRLKVKKVEPTEFVHLEVRHGYEDFNYLMENGVLYHFEFESDGISMKDMRRFREYDAITGRIHEVPVITHVICSSKVRKPLSCLKEGINTYRIKVIRLKDGNADEIFKKIKNKSREKMTKADLLPMTLSPLMSGTMTQKERTAQGFSLLQETYPNISQDDRRRMQAILYILSCKFLTEEEIREVKEVISVNLLGQLYLDDGKALGRVEGRAEGRAEAILELLGDVGNIAADLSGRIMGEKNEETLRKWLKLAAKAKSVEEFEESM